MVIETSIPTIDEEMEKELLRALREEMLVGGKSVELFEQEFARFVGSQYAVAVNSGTDALFITLRCMGITGKVITPPMSFVATAESIVLGGARPSFVDIDPNTWNIDVEKIEDAIDGETVAIMPVHLYGLPCNMKRIQEIAEDHNLFVIEDCAQAHGAMFNGKKVGTIGDAGCYSFYSTKNMTVGGNGGIIVTDDKQVADKAKLLREHGGSNNAIYIGYNARINTINAAFGRVQLKRLNEWVAKRQQIAEHYKKQLKDVKTQKGEGNVYHLFGIQTEQRDRLKDHLKSKGIFTGVHYPHSIAALKPYQEFAESKTFSISDHHAKTCLSLPMHPQLSFNDVDVVCREIAAFKEANV